MVALASAEKIPHVLNRHREEHPFAVGRCTDDDADYPPALVQQRAARVAGIDWSLRLDRRGHARNVVGIAPPVVRSNLRHDSLGQRPQVSLRVADYCIRGAEGGSHPSTSPGAAWRGRTFREGAFMSLTLYALPLSVRSRLPVHPVLIRLYLLSPWKPLGRQMLVRCRAVATGSHA